MRAVICNGELAGVHALLVQCITLPIQNGSYHFDHSGALLLDRL
jgi:hypothetical protein